MRFLVSLLFLAAIAAAAPGQSIDGPDEVDAGKPVWFSITDVPEGASAVFFPTGQLTVDGTKIASNHALFWTETAGAYPVFGVVTTVTVDWDAKTASIKQVPLSKTVTVTGEAPSGPFRKSLRLAGRHVAGGGGDDPHDVAPEGLCDGPRSTLQPPGGHCGGGQCRNCR